MARSLARHGVPVDAIITKPFDILQYSSAVRSTHELLDLHLDPSRLIELLIAKGKDWAGWALIPTNDFALSAIARHRDQLDPWYPPTVRPWEITRRVVDKSMTQLAAEKVGLDLPRSLDAARAHDVAEELSYPALIKPVQSHQFSEFFGAKLFLVHTPDELGIALARVEQAGLEASIVEYVPGDDDQCVCFATYMGADGTALGAFCYRRLRQVPKRFGTASAARPADIPEIHEPSIELLRELEWRGPAVIEYKRDERNGNYRFLEVNGRNCASNGMVAAAGFNHPLWAFREHVAKQPIEAHPTEWNGTWIHLHADLLHRFLGRSTADSSWSDFTASYRGQRIFAAWSRRDPRPFLVQWGRSFHQALSLPFSRKARMETSRQLEDPMRPTRVGH